MVKELFVKKYNAYEQVLDFNNVENNKIIFKGYHLYNFDLSKFAYYEMISHNFIIFETKPEKLKLTYEISEVAYKKFGTPILEELLLASSPLAPKKEKEKVQHIGKIKEYREKMIYFISELNTMKNKDW